MFRLSFNQFLLSLRSVGIIWGWPHAHAQGYMIDTQPLIVLWRERRTRSLIGDLAGPEASAPLSLSWEQATVPFWPATRTLSYDNSLQCVHTVEATTRRHSIFFFAVRHTRRYGNPPSTSTLPTLDACGPSFLESTGAVTWPPPPTGSERGNMLFKWHVPNHHPRQL